jgi:hypothetical protein
MVAVRIGGRFVDTAMNILSPLAVANSPLLSAAAPPHRCNHDVTFFPF